MNITSQDIRRVLIGRPLASNEAPHQTIGKTIGLAVFASDALSSVAYAPGEILLVLLGAGIAATVFSLPIAFAIVVLLAILTISYRQTIFAYPGGGGAYIVARDNIGEAPAQVAGAALLTDYILTVAVSITSGWENVVATFPALQPYKALLSVLTIVVMTIVNLRGVKESGRVFAVPTYFFIGMLFITMGIAAFRYLTGTLPVVSHPAEMMEMLKNNAQSLGLFLVLRAFSSGCTALTGVEAISNGITAFKEPKSRNAATTMLVMSCLIAINLLGIVFFAHQMNILPHFDIVGGHVVGDSAVLPYMTEALVGANSPIHWMLVIATMLVLMMAANTSYADFPRLCALHAGDGFLPRQLTFRGSRLVFSWGIVALAVASITLVVVFGGSTSALIPLYAIGVFLSFGMSQAGMVLRWRKTSHLKPGETRQEEHSTLNYDPHWRIKMFINGLGSVMSIVVMIVFAVTKFAQGAWITVILIPTLVFVFFRIHHHYKDVALALSTSDQKLRPHKHDMLTVVMVDDVHAGTVEMVDFAMSEGNEWTAVHLDDNPAKTAKTIAKWNERMLADSGKELTIVPCPYRNLSETAVEFIQQKLRENDDRFVHVIMGQLVMDTWQAQALHANTNISFYMALQQMDRVAVTNVTYQIHKPGAATPGHAPESEPASAPAGQNSAAAHQPGE
ncbi:MAG TPA: APC family permease [Thermoflexales bacterium]|nr:APC family permease [Thermoflexales bacterium]HQW34493.1 APC family permease [Thermoflexales bacterium]HQZ98764.1 APC family permease [Thermoflexales bacterium]